MTSWFIYCVILLNTSLLFIHHLIYIFRLLFLYTKHEPMLKDHLYGPINNAPNSIYPKKVQVTLSEENRAPPKQLSKLVNKNITLNLNIASHFLNILGYPDVSTWFTKGGPVTRTIKHLGLKKSPKDSSKNVVHG